MKLIMDQLRGTLYPTVTGFDAKRYWLRYWYLQSASEPPDINVTEINLPTNVTGFDL